MGRLLDAWDSVTRTDQAAARSRAIILSRMLFTCTHKRQAYSHTLV
eukprot:COSAG05_NODE_2230_length_3362_cov_2.287466_5_plen_46_part_00